MKERCCLCEDFKRLGDGFVCKIDGHDVKPDDEPKLYDGRCFVHRKSKMDEELISEMRRRAGRIGGSKPKRGRKKVERVQMQIAKFDHDVIVAYAKTFKEPKSIVSTIHFLAKYILQEHPEIKKPKGWIDEL